MTFLVCCLPALYDEWPPFMGVEGQKYIPESKKKGEKLQHICILARSATGSKCHHLEPSTLTPVTKWTQFPTRSSSLNDALGEFTSSRWCCMYYKSDKSITRSCEATRLNKGGKTACRL